MSDGAWMERISILSKYVYCIVYTRMRIAHPLCMGVLLWGRTNRDMRVYVSAVQNNVHTAFNLYKLFPAVGHGATRDVL